MEPGLGPRERRSFGLSPSTGEQCSRFGGRKARVRLTEAYGCPVFFRDALPFQIREVGVPVVNQRPNGTCPQNEANT